MSGLGWVIILRGADGREYTMEHADLSINDSSVTVVWYGKDWPPLATLSTLDLCGATPVFMGQSRTPSRIRCVLPGHHLTTPWLCDFRKVTLPLQASVSSSAKCGGDYSATIY